MLKTTSFVKERSRIIIVRTTNCKNFRHQANLEKKIIIDMITKFFFNKYKKNIRRDHDDNR